MRRWDDGMSYLGAPSFLTWCAYVGRLPPTDTHAGAKKAAPHGRRAAFHSTSSLGRWSQNHLGVTRKVGACTLLVSLPPQALPAPDATCGTLRHNPDTGRDALGPPARRR